MIVSKDKKAFYKNISCKYSQLVLPRYYQTVKYNAKSITRERTFNNDEGFIQQEEIAILNLEAPNNIALK